MKNHQTSGIGTIAVGICLSLVLSRNPFNLAAGIIFIIAGVLQLIANRKNTE